MNRRLALIGLAVVLALIGTFAVYSYAHHADQRAIAGTQSANVLIVQKRVPAGTSWTDVLKGGYLSEQRVPVGSAPTSAIPKLDAVVSDGQVATTEIEPGQIVLRPMFGEKTVTTGILKIPAGKIAVAVTVPSSADVAGFVQNGSQVAIFSTFKLGKSATGDATAKANPVTGGTDLYVTKLLLARADVIATSQDAPGDLNGGKNAATSGTGNVLVTLAVSQADAERLILSQQVGQLYLGLLSDTSVTAPDGGTLNIAKFKPVPVFVK